MRVVGREQKAYVFLVVYGATSTSTQEFDGPLVSLHHVIPIFLAGKIRECH